MQRADPTKYTKWMNLHCRCWRMTTWSLRFLFWVIVAFIFTSKIGLYFQKALKIKGTLFYWLHSEQTQQSFRKQPSQGQMISLRCQLFRRSLLFIFSGVTTSFGRPECSPLKSAYKFSILSIDGAITLIKFSLGLNGAFPQKAEVSLHMNLVWIHCFQKSSVTKTTVSYELIIGLSWSFLSIVWRFLFSKNRMNTPQPR